MRRIFSPKWLKASKRIIFVTFRAMLNGLKCRHSFFADSFLHINEFEHNKQTLRRKLKRFSLNRKLQLFTCEESILIDTNYFACSFSLMAWFLTNRVTGQKNELTGYTFVKYVIIKIEYSLKSSSYFRLIDLFYLLSSGLGKLKSLDWIFN